MKAGTPLKTVPCKVCGKRCSATVGLCRVHLYEATPPVERGPAAAKFGHPFVRDTKFVTLSMRDAEQVPYPLDRVKVYTFWVDGRTWQCFLGQYFAKASDELLPRWYMVKEWVPPGENAHAVMKRMRKHAADVLSRPGWALAIPTPTDRNKEASNG